MSTAIAKNEDEARAKHFEGWSRAKSA